MQLPIKAGPLVAPTSAIMAAASAWWFGDDGASLHARQIYYEANLFAFPHAILFIEAWTAFMHLPDQTKFEDAKTAFTLWKQWAAS
jgi:hypothetical protein